MALGPFFFWTQKSSVEKEGERDKIAVLLRLTGERTGLTLLSLVSYL